MGNVWDDEQVFPADKSRQGASFYLINSEWERNARKAGEACRPKNFFRGGRQQRDAWKLHRFPQKPVICLPTSQHKWLSILHLIFKVDEALTASAPSALLTNSAGKEEDKTEQAEDRQRMVEQKVYSRMVQESTLWLPSRNEFPAGLPILVNANYDPKQLYSKSTKQLQYRAVWDSFLS